MDLFMFTQKNDFWKWLENNHETHKGIWIKFDKTKTTSLLTANEALECALCFGWIDGVIKRVDETYYMKYFAKRTEKSIWSTKNKKTVERLIIEGMMMPSGYNAIEVAKKDGRWDKADLPPEDFSIENFKKILKDHQLAYMNYLEFSSSIQKTYAMSYYTLKKTDSRDRRLKVIIDRLEKQLKPM